jgi:DNA-binding NtrC family response regulator
MPPLRERASDIPLLVSHFLTELRGDAVERRFDDESMQRLQDHHWPGNVRELRHVVQRALVMADADAKELSLPKQLDSPIASSASTHGGIEPGRSIRDVERELIELTLAHFGGDKKAAADTLGISLNTLYNRLNAYRDPDAR